MARNIKTGKFPFINDLTASELRQLLNYDPDTGEFTWKAGRRDRAGRPLDQYAERTAGRIDRQNRIGISVNCRRYLAHRLAWLYVYGEWPKSILDHINGNGLDNRISNLRECTQSQNLFNRTKQKNNTTGYKGVSRFKKRWTARIVAKGRIHYLGYFDSPEDAHLAYVKAAKRLHKEFATF